MDEKNIACLRCNVPMQYVKTEKIQLGEAGIFFDHLNNVIAGSLNADIYMCPQCGKFEFFDAHFKNSIEEDDFDESIDILPKIVCEECGRSYDIDYPKCPFCGCGDINE